MRFIYLKRHFFSKSFSKWKLCDMENDSEEFFEQNSGREFSKFAAQLIK